jgi:hypothetical protein
MSKYDFFFVEEWEDWIQGFIHARQELFTTELHPQPQKWLEIKIFINKIFDKPYKWLTYPRISLGKRLSIDSLSQ